MRPAPSACGAAPAGPVDLALVLADGLSAVAVQRHAVPVLRALREALGRHAVDRAAGDRRSRRAWRWPTRSASCCGASLVLILIGERPGLSSPDSLGVYLTYAPRVGRIDAQRNCVTNIRPEGLAPEAAAQRLAWLLREARGGGSAAWR